MIYKQQCGLKDNHYNHFLMAVYAFLYNICKTSYSQELLEKKTKLTKEFSEYRRRREELMRDRRHIFDKGR